MERTGRHSPGQERRDENDKVQAQFIRIANISDHATIKVFTSAGYRVVHEGNNGFVCIVMRGFTGAPTYTPLPVRTYLARKLRN